MHQRRNRIEEILKQDLPVKRVFPKHSKLRGVIDNLATVLHAEHHSEPPRFIVKGQGILQVVPQDHHTIPSQPDQDSTSQKPFKSLKATLSTATKENIVLVVTPEGIECTVEQQGKSDKLQGCFLPKKPEAGELSKTDCVRWFSLDYENERLSYGQGEVRKETEIIQFAFDKHQFRWVHDVEEIKVEGEYKELIAWRDPVLLTTPMRVMRDDDITMDMAAVGEAVVAANLTDECQKLYANICGKNFKIDNDDFPDFSRAVNASINIEGRWCYNKLRSKIEEFGEPDLNATYLRITLGKNQGNSPGVPYVMEIWPAEHYSPIHNHSHANAVIRVLHGEIHVELFSYFSVTNKKPFLEADFKEGEVTFLTPDLNQTHRLTNLNKEGKACVTIQCYLYKKEDNSHYEFFDYIDNDGKSIGHYEPDSDMDYIEFKKKMREEWDATPEEIKNKF